MFIADTYVNADPTAEQIAEITLLAAEEIRRFGITPKVALVSHSSFGSSSASAGEEDAGRRSRSIDADGPRPRGRRRDARRRGAVRRGAPCRCCPISRLKGERQPADHADARRGEHLVRSFPRPSPAGGGVTLGPILLGVARPVHILTPSATVRRIVNMTALTVVERHHAKAGTADSYVRLSEEERHVEAP